MYVPVGVELLVLMVNVLEKDGLPDPGLKLQETPKGRPLVQDKLIDCDEPVCRVAVTVFEPEPPCVTAIPPEFDNK